MTDSTITPAAPAPATPAVAAPAVPAGAAATLFPESTPAPTPAPAEPAPPALTLPGKDATPEAWKAYYKAIGAPESADAYQLPVPDGQDGAFAKTAAGWMAEAGLLPHQAAQLAGKWNEFMATHATQSQADAAKAEQDALTARDTKAKAEDAALRNEWGQGHEQNVGLARQAATRFFGDKAADIIESIETAVGYGQTMRIMHAIGQGLGEGKARGLDSGGAQTPRDPASVLYPGS